MTPDQQHVIGAHVIQLRLQREGEARPLMDRVGALWRSRIAAETEQLFSSRCPPERRVRLNRLELSLGTIPAAEFETEFPARFLAALAAELARLWPARAGDESTDRAKPATSVLDVLEFVLRHGFLPWWAVVQPDFDPARELVAQLRANPHAVAALARRIGRHRRVRVRLVQWLDDPAIAALIRAVAAGDAEFILRYADDLQARQDEQRIVNATAEEFRHAKWEVILAHLLADRGSRFNTKAFLRQTIAGLAACFRIRYTDFLSELARAAYAEDVTWREASLPQLLRELYFEDVVTATSQDLSRVLAEPASSNPPPAAPTTPGGATAAEQRWMEAWGRALRAPPMRWSPIQRRALSFWPEVPPETARRILARLIERFGRTEIASGIAAIATRGETTVLAGLWEQAAAQASRAGAGPTDEASRPPAPVFESVIRVLSEILGSPPATLTAEQTAALAAWQRWPASVRESAEPEMRDALDAPGSVFRAETAGGRSEEPGRLDGADGSPTEESGDGPDRATGIPGSEPAFRFRRREGESNLPWPIGEQATEHVFPALRRLLETGTLPGATWAARWQDRREAWLELVLVEYAEALRPVLRAWARETPLTRTIPVHLAEATLASMVETLADGHGDEMLELVTILTTGKPRWGEVDAGSIAFRRAAWTIVLDYLVSESGSPFQRRALLDHTIERLASRHRLPAATVAEYLLASAEQTRGELLIRDLRVIHRAWAQADRRPARPGEDDEADTPAKSADQKPPPPSSYFTAERLRRSPVARLRLLKLVLEGAARSRESVISRLLPELWERIASTDEPEIVRELHLAHPPAPAAVARMVATGGTKLLEKLIFAGEPAQAETWHRAVAWLETSPAAAGLLPGGRAGLRVRLWHSLLHRWREGGGHPVRNAAEWLARVLLTFGRTVTMDRVGTALAADRSGTAGQLANRLSLLPRKTAAPVPPAKEPADETPASGPEVDAPILVSNAGLVLLAPFLPDLYRRCRLLEGDGFRDFRTNQIAVHLLQYLAAGGVRSFEYTLVLNKVLCGLDVAQPVVAEVELEAPTVAQANELLEYVASQWPRGANLSPEGLRRTYLVRPGRLQRRDQCWHLKVESRGWDVLLPELPWSFGRAHAPWMPLPLEVDWI